MNNRIRVYSFCFLFCCIFSLLVTVETSSSSDLNKAGVLQCLETEIWDTADNAWKASGERWTNERGHPSESPSEIKPPDGFEFEGDWKIVMSGGDSLGWEYSFQYLRPPKRRRIWLRSLKQIELVQPRFPSSSIVDVFHYGQVRGLSRALARIRDDFNFKGFGLSVYKSLVFPSSIAVAFRLPLSMNFDTWDRHPELPNVSTNVCFMFPWAVGAFLSGSVHLEYVKWLIKSLFQFIPRLVLTAIYDFILPVIWVIGAAILSPTNYRLPPLPKAPTLTINKPVYNSDLSERIGCSVSYRWSQQRGLEWRFSYWHSYLPTLALYRKILKLATPTDFWQKHFGSIGLSTTYPIPVPPSFSCSAHLCLSGLYFKGKRGESTITEMSTTVNANQEEFQGIKETDLQARQLEQIGSPRIVTTTAKSLT